MLSAENTGEEAMSESAKLANKQYLEINISKLILSATINAGLGRGVAIRNFSTVVSYK